MTPRVNSENRNSDTLYPEERHFFGMKKQGIFPQQDMTDDYTKRFPEDPYGEEAGPNARVWRTYLVERGAIDKNMIGEARDGLDAMLVFAGLFSAVVTSFLVQTSQNLQADFSEMSASLLYDLVALQRAAAAGTSAADVPLSLPDPTTRFTPDTIDIWLNSLWVVSLSLSLVVALAAVLVKQWLHRYMAMNSGPAKERSYIRQFRLIGFEKWHVQGIIGSLPVIMHVSLALFFLGFILFLIPLQFVLGCIVGAITFVVYVLYLASNILPIFDPQCPYQTPLSDAIVVFSQYLSSAFRTRSSYYLDIRIDELGIRFASTHIRSPGYFCAWFFRLPPVILFVVFEFNN